MSDIEPNKLKVTELRDELKRRGLDTKGKKEQLVKRLKQALGIVGQDGEADDSQADLDDADLSQVTDTSTLDVSTAADLAPERAAPFVVSDSKAAECVAVAAATTDVQLDEPGAAEPVTPEAAPVAVEFKPVAVATEPPVTVEAEPPVAVEAEPPVAVEAEPPVAVEAEPPVAVEAETPVAVEAEPPVAVEAEPPVAVEAEPPVAAEAEPEVTPAGVKSTLGAVNAKSLECVAGPVAAEVKLLVAVEAKSVPAEAGKEKHAASATEPMPVADEAHPAAAEGMDQGEADIPGGHTAEAEAMCCDSSHIAESNGETIIDTKVTQCEGDGGENQAARKRSRSPRHRSQSPPQRQRRSRSRTPPPPLMDDDAWLQSTELQLDRYSSDLNLVIKDEHTAVPLCQGGFAFMWAGVRATYGVRSGKVAFEFKIVDEPVVDLPDDETNKHVARVGWSTDLASTQLGEDSRSWGYGGTGKASHNNTFTSYGQAFGKDDVVTAYLDMDADPCVMSFSKNGEDLGVAYEVSKSILQESALFPHVLSKNCEFICNFGQKESFFPVRGGYSFIGSVPAEERVRGTLPPQKKEDAEVLMLIGLPGAGKTYWAGKHVETNVEKKYNTLGTNAIIDKMKVMGLPRKLNYSGRWDVLFDKSNKCLAKLIELAAKKCRNYIIDQTNVYATAQRRKMKPFEGFQRKAIVVVPSDEEFKKRIEKRAKEEGKEIPLDAVLEMKANFSVPQAGGDSVFDTVIFTDLPDEEARKLTEQYVKEGQVKFPPGTRRFRDDRRGGDQRGGRFSDHGVPTIISGRDRSYPAQRDNKGDRRYGGNSGSYRGGSYGSSYGGGGYGASRYEDRSRSDRGHYAGAGGNGRYQGSQNPGYNRGSGGYGSAYSKPYGGAWNGAGGQSGGWGGQQQQGWTGGAWSGQGGGAYGQQQSWGSQQAGAYGSQWNYSASPGYQQQQQPGYGAWPAQPGSQWGSQGGSQQGYGNSWGYGSGYNSWGQPK